jgi:hypothetical protein
MTEVSVGLCVKVSERGVRWVSAAPGTPEHEGGVVLQQVQPDAPVRRHSVSHVHFIKQHFLMYNLQWAHNV